MSEILLIKTADGSLRPFDDEGEEILMRWKRGDVARVKITKVRNPMFHRKFFAMLSTIWDYGGDQRYEDREAMRKALLIRAGFGRLLEQAGQKYLIEAKSISFGSMDETEFSRVYSKVLDKGLMLIGEARREDVNEAVDRMIGFA